MALPVATALRQSLKGYNAATFKSDATAGLVVALIALPLSMALAIAVGLPPQHGLYTAIVAGIVCAALGGSTTQVSGPTAAFIVILAPIVREHGLNGLIIAGMMAGAMVSALGLLRVGRFITHVPHAVITGFTSGIAVTIAMLSLNDLFALEITDLHGSFIEKSITIYEHVHLWHLPDTLIGLCALGTMFFVRARRPRWPAAVIGVGAGLALCLVLSFFGLDAATIGARFSHLSATGETVAGIYNGAPHLHMPEIPSYTLLRQLFSPALIIAALAALETLLSATVADRIARTKHDPDAELTATGIGNIFAGLFGGIPATGALARTAANIHAGAQTPVAAIVHSMLILMFMLTLGPLINAVPMAALSALLLITAWRMSEAPEFMRIARGDSRSQRVILLVTFFLTIMVDMVAGISGGVIAAFFFHAIKRHNTIS